MPDDLIVRLHTVTGKPYAWSAMYTVNMRNLPFWAEWRQVAPGDYAVRGPKESPFGLAVMWEVPGFGKMIITADNEGAGYRADEGRLIDFRREAAVSRVARVRRRLAGFRQAGYVPTAADTAKLDLAQRLLSQADAQQGEAQARLLDQALSAAMWAGEEIELAHAEHDIAAMTLEARRAKLFGASFFSLMASPAFKQRFVEVFNFATAPFYRRALEPIEGQPRWRERDRLLDWYDIQALARKGHPLTWWTDHGLTEWMKKLSYKSLKELLYQQVYDTVTRYRDRIKVWDVINEAHDPAVMGNEGYLSDEQICEVTALAAKAVRDADPEAVRIININRPWGVYRSLWEQMDPMHAIEYIEMIADYGVEYEINGVQMYHGGPSYHYVHDIMDQSALLDQYAALGKPIHISEVQTPSSMVAEPAKWAGGEVEPSGWWHRPWDLETQADWVQQFYTMASAKPTLEAITWWNLSDSASFWPHGGLLDANDQPKPSYYRLQAFIKSFRGE